jgi:hypothetical protein
MHHAPSGRRAPFAPAPAFLRVVGRLCTTLPRVVDRLALPPTFLGHLALPYAASSLSFTSRRTSRMALLLPPLPYTPRGLTLTPPGVSTLHAVEALTLLADKAHYRTRRRGALSYTLPRRTILPVGRSYSLPVYLNLLALPQSYPHTSFLPTFYPPCFVLVWIISNATHLGHSNSHFAGHSRTQADDVS